MESKIEQKIRESRTNVEDLYGIYREILNLDSTYANKEKLLVLLKSRSFAVGVDMSNLIIPKQPRTKVKIIRDSEPNIDENSSPIVPVINAIDLSFQESASSTIDAAEYDFLSRQLGIIEENFSFLFPVVLKSGIQIDAFSSIFICCSQISVDYMNTYFADDRHVFRSCDNLPTDIESVNAYIFILLWPHDKKGNQEAIEKIKKIKNLKHLDFKAFERRDSYWRGETYFADEMSAYLEISYDFPIVNMHLLVDQERLIRTAVGSPTGFLTYKVLHGGYTGALVLEVSSVGNGHARKKFVLKIDRKDKSWDTIREEFKNFQNHIENIPLADGTVLQAQRFEYGEWEAIKYPYASKNSTGDSVSLGSSLKGAKSKGEMKSIVSKIFEHSLITSWAKTFSSKNEALFDSYRKLDYKIESFDRIVEFQKKYNYDDVFDFEILKEYFRKRYDVIYCISHGDFHIENIRVDAIESKQDVFFIDFGRTGQYPMGIDHAALECSIRYGFLGKDYRIKDLVKMDDEYFDNFSELLSLDSEGDLSRVNYIISLIREAYLNGFPNHHRQLAEQQYYHNIFSVSSWLMNKDNLNRQYIWEILKRVYEKNLKLALKS
ncbi:ecdysteroid 22-kinase family protein [Bdellovibrio bacteriovorus]|uniref:ecdysteroid 22-kinase family protein n=1 Tax=Bdellovibrio bacteriovorus TaxID=959 RepID=UPI0021D314EF|nr:ecdysteroid 22-kinase family protein [Bdellovibrio bacteriovorus]UXR65652.1 ecdysteroid 22-kinase family protein [Bdellovibrio bacteriovorus]